MKTPMISFSMGYRQFAGGEVRVLPRPPFERAARLRSGFVLGSYDAVGKPYARPVVARVINLEEFTDDELDTILATLVELCYHKHQESQE